jgi:hypothetical protein
LGIKKLKRSGFCPKRSHIDKYKISRQIYKFWGTKNTKKHQPLRVSATFVLLLYEKIINYRLLAHSFVLHLVVVQGTIAIAEFK